MCSDLGPFCGEEQASPLGREEQIPDCSLYALLGSLYQAHQCRGEQAAFLQVSSSAAQASNSSGFAVLRRRMSHTS